MILSKGQTSIQYHTGNRTLHSN